MNAGLDPLSSVLLVVGLVLLAWCVRLPLARVLCDGREQIRRGYGDEARPRRGAAVPVLRVLDPRHLELALMAEAVSPAELMLPAGASREAARRSGYPDDFLPPVDLPVDLFTHHHRRADVRRAA